MRRIRLIASLVILVGMLVAPVSAQAAGLLPDCSGSGSESAVCKDQTTKNPLVGPDGILLKAAEFISILAGIAAVIMIIIAGLQFVTSSGDPAKTQSAKNMIIYALIGLVVIALAGSAISFVLSRL